MKVHRYKFCSIVAARVSVCGVCTECRAACDSESNGPKLVGAKIRYFNVNFNILCV